MRNALIAPNNRLFPLPQVLLLVFLQVVLCHGSIVYRRTERRTSGSLGGLRPAPENQKAALQSTVLPEVAPPPRLEALGFFVRGDAIRTPDDVRAVLPQILNRTDARQRQDGRLWKELVARLTSDNLTDVNRQRDTVISRHRTSSHINIPHLVRLGFGAANRTSVFSYPDAGLRGQHSGSARRDTGGVMKTVRHVIVVGVGSFFAGMLVILSAFLVVVVVRRRRRGTTTDDVNSTREEPKLSLIRHQTAPAIDDVRNELSTTSYSSTSSGSGDTWSHASDTSHTSDLWYSPDNKVRPFYQDPAMVTVCSPTNSQMLTEKDDSGTAVADPEMTSPAVHSCHGYVSVEDSIQMVTGVRTRVTNEASSSNNPADTCFVDIVPDLLLPSRAAREVGGVLDQGSCTRSVSEEGGILSCAGGDVVVIVPPGAVREECCFLVQVRNVCYPGQLNNSEELILSPVIDLCVSGTELFQKAITLKLPYRALCACVSSVLTLRCGDQSTHTWISAGKHLNNALVNRSAWPECLSPDLQERDGCVGTRQATHSCFSNICTIQTNTAGTFYLTSRSPDHNHSRCTNQLSSLSTSYHDNNIRLCMAIGGKYHLDYRGDDDVGTKSYIRQINYTIYVSDNTVCGRQKIEQLIRASGGQLHCTCIPLDVAVGSEIKFTLGSVLDPEWPWEIPFDSPSKVIGWRELCGDYNSVIQVEFRCLPRSDDVLRFMADDENIVCTFQVETDQHTENGVDSIKINMMADSGSC